MTNLKRAHHELFAREPDQRFRSVETLYEACSQEQGQSCDHWIAPRELSLDVQSQAGSMLLADRQGHRFRMNDWSFGQLCRLSGIQKKTVNRLSMSTAASVLDETLPRGNKPLQVFASDARARSIHGTTYTRLLDLEVLELVSEVADDFQPPPPGVSGGTGIYRGEQDMFLFLVDPNGWIEIGEQRFAPARAEPRAVDAQRPDR